MAVYPDDLATMHQGIRDWVNSVLPTGAGWSCVFGEVADNPPQPPKPFVFIVPLGAPLPQGYLSQQMPGTAVQVLTVLNDTDYVVNYEGSDVTFTSDADATEAEIVAGLVFEINTAAGTTVARELLGVVQVDIGTVTTTDPNLQLQALFQLNGEAFLTWSIGFIGREDQENEANVAMGRMLAALQDEASTDTFIGLDLGWIRASNPIRVPTLDGAQWRDRMSVDLTFSACHQYQRIGDFAESATITRAT